jgi:nickel superoxide dismutase
MARVSLRDWIAPRRTVRAHCDIPCGIYDPFAAQQAAETVATMVTKINQLPKDPSTDDRNTFVRMVTVKEQHAELCKREVLILWTDYFKAEHLKQHATLHETVWKATKLCSDNKRTISAEKAQQLKQAVDEIARIFHETKKAAATPAPAGVKA